MVEMEGRETIMLGSNNYLGLTGDERVKEAARDALETYGTGLTGLAAAQRHHPLHVELERELAEWMGTEDAIVFTTGYQANVGCIGTILGPGDTVICDSGDHASILDGCRLSGAKLRPFRHNRMDKLERMLERAAGDGGGVLVIVDGVFSMEGDLCDLPAIVELCERHGARLMVDEAHAVGVLGEPRSRRPASSSGSRTGSTCGWAPSRRASPPAAASSPGPRTSSSTCGSRRAPSSSAPRPCPPLSAPRSRALRIIRPRGQLFSTGCSTTPPTCAEGFTDLGLEVVEPADPARRQRGTTPVVPVVVGEDWQAVLLWKALFDAGVYTNVAHPPRGAAGRRAAADSLMATHEREHLDRALAIFAESRTIRRLAPLTAGPPDPRSIPPRGLSPCPILDKPIRRTKTMLLANAGGGGSRLTVDGPATSSRFATRRRTRGRERTGRDRRSPSRSPPTPQPHGSVRTDTPLDSTPSEEE